MGFRALRVINEDRVEAGQGFGTHGHRDMEIVTCVLEGAVEHKDNIGNGAILRPGEFQRMSAGTGIRHSELNPSESEGAHFYQIWLMPDRPGHEPSYEQKQFDPAGRANRLQLVASADGRSGSLRIHQQAAIYLADLASNAIIDCEVAADRHLWVQALRGSLSVSGKPLSEGDGAAVSDISKVALSTADSTAEIMVFDLA